MLNWLRAPIGKAITPLGRALVKAGVTPDMVTVAGTVGATVAALICYPRGEFFVGTLLIWGFVMFDMVDGAVARIGGRGSRFGAVLDSSCDRVADAAVFGTLSWYFARHDQPALLLAGLLCLVLGSLTSYIKARAEGAGFTCNVGVAERSERLIVVLVGTGLDGFPGLHVPYVQAIALWLLVAASAITVGQRITTVWQQSRAAAGQPRVGLE